VYINNQNAFFKEVPLWNSFIQGSKNPVNVSGWLLYTRHVVSQPHFFWGEGGKGIFCGAKKNKFGGQLSPDPAVAKCLLCTECTRLAVTNWWRSWRMLRTRYHRTRYHYYTSALRNTGCKRYLRYFLLNPNPNLLKTEGPKWSLTLCYSIILIALHIHTEWSNRPTKWYLGFNYR